MSENEPSRQSVKIPLDLIAEAAPYMTRQGYKFQGLLLELFESWLGQQKANVANGSSAQSSRQHKETVFDQLMAMDPKGAKKLGATIEHMIEQAKERENARPQNTVAGDPSTPQAGEARASASHAGKARKAAR